MLFNPFRANSILFYLQTPFANTNPSLSYCFYYSTPVGPFQRTAGEIHNLVKLSSFSLSQIAALFSILCYTTENRHKRGAACRLLWRAPLPTVQKGAPTMSQITDFYFPSSAGLCPIHARQWLPDHAPYAGVVQLLHGIAEHLSLIHISEPTRP